MKKSAFFVEGQTERIFLEGFIDAVGTGLNYTITSIQAHGADTWVTLRSPSTSEDGDFHISIIDVGNDERVNTYLEDRIGDMKKKGFSALIGVRDRYTGDTKRKPINVEKSAEQDARLTTQWQLTIEVIIAIEELEAWFMASPNFFRNFDKSLTPEAVRSILHYDIERVDVEAIRHPTAEIKKVLATVGKIYRKREHEAQKIAATIDYSNLYLDKSQTIPALARLCRAIDLALTPQ